MTDINPAVQPTKPEMADAAKQAVLRDIHAKWDKFSPTDLAALRTKDDLVAQNNSLKKEMLTITKKHDEIVAAKNQMQDKIDALQSEVENLNAPKVNESIDQTFADTSMVLDELAQEISTPQSPVPAAPTFATMPQSPASSMPSIEASSIPSLDFLAPPPQSPFPAADITPDIHHRHTLQNSSSQSLSSMPSISISPSSSNQIVAPSPEITVHGFSHQGLSVQFKCTKPECMDTQKSVIVAHFANSTGAPLHGLHLQVAVPKYITMKLKPPTSTTVPVSGSNQVTQTIYVTNTMLGTKKVMLKLRCSFTSNGQRVEHMATCSGFPVGQY